MTTFKIFDAMHGTNLKEPFPMFDASFTGKGYDVAGGGFYFTDCVDTAKHYARMVKEGKERADPFMYVANLTFERPFFRQNRDNCEPIMIPMSRIGLNSILDRAPLLHDRDNSPLINFGESEAVLQSNILFDQERRRLAYRHGRHYYADGEVNINSLENDWFNGYPEQFRRALYNASGYDGVIVSFADGTNTLVAWFEEQIEITRIENGHGSTVRIPSVLQRA